MIQVLKVLVEVPVQSVWLQSVAAPVEIVARVAVSVAAAGARHEDQICDSNVRGNVL